MRGLAAAAMLAATCASLPAGAAETPPEQQRIFQDYGGLTVATVDEQGTVWLALWEPHIRYRVTGEPEARLAALKVIVERADEGARAVALRYDGSAGRLNAKSGHLEYPLCSIAMDDLSFAPAKACDTSAPPWPADPASALALANAHATVGHDALAKRLLERSDLPADPAFRKLLLRVRAKAEQGIAAEAERASPEGDRALAAALADFRALALLEPEDAEHRLAIATLLVELGGYVEAAAMYDQILAEWPDEDYRVTVSRAALHRYQGHYDKALDTLNQLVARNGPQPGMKFHYHRGWLLTLAGRYDEAIVEFSEGLRSQPDYSSAYLRRACAYAAVGRLRDAVDDVGEAVRLYADLPASPTSKWLQDDLAEAAEFRARLEAAIARGGNRPVTGCAGPNWKRIETPRPRSPLLPAV